MDKFGCTSPFGHYLDNICTNSTIGKQAFELFDVIQTLDRPKLAILLANLTQERGFCPSLFIQVNTGKEETKSGVFPEKVNPGRAAANVRPFSIGKNPNPAQIKFSGTATYDT